MLQFKKWAWLAGCALGLAGCYVPPPAQLVVLPGQGKSYTQFQTDDTACRPPSSVAALQPHVASAAPQPPLASTGSLAPATTVPPPTTGVQAAGPDLSAPENYAYMQCMAARGNNVVPVPQAYPYPAYTYGYTAYSPWAWGPAYWGWPGYYGLAVAISPWYGGWGWRGGGWGWGGGWHGGWGGGWHGGWAGGGGWGGGGWGGGGWHGGGGGGGGWGGGGWGGGGGFHGGGGGGRH